MAGRDCETSCTLLILIFQSAARDSREVANHFDMFTIIVMLSPLSKIRPTVFRVPFFLFTSSASSSTRFMYSSKPCDGGGRGRPRLATRDAVRIQKKPKNNQTPAQPRRLPFSLP